MKKQHAQTVLVSLLVLLVLALAGCGGKGEGASTQESAPQEDTATQESASTQESAFKGREPRDASEMEQYKKKALENATQRRAVKNADKDEAKLVEEVDKDFEAANEQYKKGDYTQAQKGYEEVLKTYPQHYGANVNLTLALLQQKKNEMALVQALSSLSLYPNDDGIPLNVQTAAVASGFTADDALTVAAEVVSESEGGSKVSKKRSGELAYNDLWDRIETEMWKAAHAEDSDTQVRETYEALHKELAKELKNKLSTDEDAQALMAYLEAIGKQFGIAEQSEDNGDSTSSSSSSSSSSKSTRSSSSSSSSSSAKKTKEANIDFSTVEPHVGLPYVVADDENCTVIFTGYHMSSDKPVAEFAMLNKTSDKKLRMQAEDAIANGVQIQNFSGAYVHANAGEQGTGWGSFFGKDGDKTVSLVKGELKEMTCVITVSDFSGTTKKDLATYPLSWKADESGKNEMEVDKKKVIDQKDVFSLTATGVRGANDDVVEVEYSSGYHGEGNISFDSKDDWKVNGVDMQLLNAGLQYKNGNGSHHYLLLKAKNSGSLGNDPVKTVTGTLVVKNADGKEIASGKLEV